MILVAYRHGLRAGELVTLRWDAVDFAHGRLHVGRLKNGATSVHPLSGRKLRALRRLKREQEPQSSFRRAHMVCGPTIHAEANSFLLILGTMLMLQNERDGENELMPRPPAQGCFSTRAIASSTRPSMFSSPPPIPSDSATDRLRAVCSHCRSSESFISRDS
jgi:hypothetical protein